VASEILQSALIIEVPEAEPAVRRHRERLDANASLGIPAHVTVLAPFMPLETIDTAVLAQIGRLFADLTRFRFQLDRTDWFGEQVLWLAPRDPAPFRTLTQRVHQAFPAFPPFEGRYDDVVPHLTIGHGHSLNELRTAEDAVQAHLPIEASVGAITLMTEQSAGGHWTKTATFALSGSTSPAAADSRAEGKIN
jgi:2'-5' RNA ligase